MKLRALIPLARIAGHYTLALIAMLVPEVGENRYLVAALLAFFFGPLAFFVSLKLKPGQEGTVEPTIDMITLLVIVALMPELWLYGLIIGVVIALAPSIAISEMSYRYYAANSALLILGLTAIAIYHEVESWLIPIAILVAVFPSTVTYSYSLNQRTQEIRRRAESLSALQLISGGIAHDFNNILMGIAGYAEFARTSAANPDSVQEAVKRIIGSTTKASQLTNQLITFAGNKQIEFKPVDYRREVKSISHSAEGSLRREVNLSVELPDSPVFINGDAVQLGQVVLNLVVNAIESIEGEGDVTVRLSTRDEMAVLEVSDTGSGIEPDRQATIFEPFVSGKERGHGLGLAVVKNIVDEHNGHIQLESKVGEGTLFRVEFPALEVAPEVATRSSTKILVADDEQAIRMILRQTLEGEGYEVLEAEDGTAFFTLFEDEGEDACAVILDIKMPGKTGWQCLDMIRETRPELPVLIVSGYDPHGPMADKPDPAMRVLSKPFRIGEIKDTIAQMIATN